MSILFKHDTQPPIYVFLFIVSHIQDNIILLLLVVLLILTREYFSIDFDFFDFFFN